MEASCPSPAAAFLFIVLHVFLLLMHSFFCALRRKFLPSALRIDRRARRGSAAETSASRKTTERSSPHHHHHRVAMLPRWRQRRGSSWRPVMAGSTGWDQEQAGRSRNPPCSLNLLAVLPVVCMWCPFSFLGTSEHITAAKNSNPGYPPAICGFAYHLPVLSSLREIKA